MDYEILTFALEGRFTEVELSQEWEATWTDALSIAKERVCALMDEGRIGHVVVYCGEEPVIELKSFKEAF